MPLNGFDGRAGPVAILPLFPDNRLLGGGGGDPGPPQNLFDPKLDLGLRDHLLG